eukprot:10481330-Ditylum_brightwellii.AAC.1
MVHERAKVPALHPMWGPRAMHIKFFKDPCPCARRARGVLLKLYMPLRWAWAERCGLDLDVQSKLRVSWACSNSLPHWQMGKTASLEHNPAMKCSLK